MIPEIPHPPQLAHIREQECIGCTKCLDACPVDAIVGAGKALHVVIEQACIGCGLCVPPCPIDCIDMLSSDRIPDVSQALARAHRKSERVTYRQQLANTKKQQLALANKRREIQEAVARAAAKRKQP